MRLDYLKKYESGSTRTHWCWWKNSLDWFGRLAQLFPDKGWPFDVVWWQFEGLVRSRTLSWDLLWIEVGTWHSRAFKVGQCWLLTYFSTRWAESFRIRLKPQIWTWFNAQGWFLISSSFAISWKVQIEVSMCRWDKRRPHPLRWGYCVGSVRPW